MHNGLRRLYYLLPPTWRFAARWLWYAPVDVWERLAGHRPPLTPPRGWIFTGSGDFHRSGRQIVGLCRELANLQASHRVLDVGSGIGRIAVALTSVLDARQGGGYEGFDIVPLGVRWCQRHISTRFPNFRFRHIPLANDLYRARGREATDFTFPYPEAAFDLVIVNSVFTHMRPQEIVRYLEEIRRVLRPGGHCWATFFLYNPGEAAVHFGNPGFAFPYDFGHYRLMDKQVQSANVALSKAWLMEQASRAGLRAQHVQYGYWRSGSSQAPDRFFQDIVVWTTT